MNRNPQIRFLGINPALCFFIIGVGFTTPIIEAHGKASKERQRVENAQFAIESFMQDSNLTWFQEHVKDAKGLLIIPQLLKGAFFFGGSGGSGVLVTRDRKTGEWSEPAFYILGSVSFGLQFGGQASEVIVMVQTNGGVEKLYSSSFKLGADAIVAAGPYGAGVEGSTSANLGADFLSFSRSKGAFVGISLEGAVIKTDDDANEAYYGQDVGPLDILVKQSVKNSHSTKLRTAVAKATQ